MSKEELFVEIDQEQSSARFYGPATFHYKENIKSLGSARWHKAEKSWIVSPFSFSEEELKHKFPNICVIHSSGEPALKGNASTEKIELREIPQELSKLPSPSSKKLGSQQEGTENSFSVRELLGEVSMALSRAFPKTVLVYGVINKLNRRGSRVFLSLAEVEKQDESLDCVIWGSEEKICQGLHDAGFKLEQDLQVMFEVEVGLNRRQGKVSLTIKKVIAEYTIAKLAALREQTNERLKKEGLFTKNKTKQLPFLPKRLGILTSATGTVIHDFQASLDVAQFAFELFWKPVSVQGQEAKREIIKGLRLLSSRKDLDAILLFRGGGSASDLSVFNDYEVCKAICECPLPIISAIGHQEDQSSAQDVSNLSFGVPKDIGRYFADIIIEKRQELSSFLGNIKDKIRELVTLREERVGFFSKNLLSYSNRIYHLAQKGIERVATSVPSLAKSYLNRLDKDFKTSIDSVSRVSMAELVRAEQKTFQVAERCFQASLRMLEYQSRLVLDKERLFLQISPDVQLQRGFVMVQGKKGVVSRANQLEKGEQVELKFYQGKANALVQEVKGGKDESSKS